MLPGGIRNSGATSMIVGVPAEIKTDEYRVGIVPAGVEELVSHGHQVIVQKGAGLGSGISDELFVIHGPSWPIPPTRSTPAPT